MNESGLGDGRGLGRLSYFCTRLTVFVMLLRLSGACRICNLHIPQDPYVFDSHSLPPLFAHVECYLAD